MQEAEKCQELPPKKGRVATCENLCLKVAESDISAPLKGAGQDCNGNADFSVKQGRSEETRHFGRHKGGRIGSPKKLEPEKT